MDVSELNMRVAGTEQGIEGVRQATETVRRAWTSGQAAIGAEEGQLGKGRMGQAFMSVYRPEAERTGQQIGAVTDGGLELVAAARQGVAEYQNTDQKLRADFERLLSPNQLMAWRR